MTTVAPVCIDPLNCAIMEAWVNSTPEQFANLITLPIFTFAIFVGAALVAIAAMTLWDKATSPAKVKVKNKYNV